MVILGGGLAGGNAARALRDEGFGGAVFLVADEPGVPFGRPPLSKTYLRGEEPLDGWLVAPAGWYATHDVDLIRDTAVRIDAASRRVLLRRGPEIEYGRLLIATGGRNRVLQVPGADLEGIHQLRTVADADALRGAARPGARAVIVGMGFIGSEVAASLRRLGVDVTAVFPGDAPLDSVLGPGIGATMTAMHREHGVNLARREQVVRFEGRRKVERAITKAGSSLPCDFVVVAVGIQPNVEFLQGSGIEVDNGILTDSMSRTSVPDVFAAGDVANQAHPLFGRIRVEHFNNAEKQGRSVARSMLGSGSAFDYLHTFWSDQYDEKLEYIGHARTWDRFVVRGSLDDRRAIGFYLRDGVVRAAVGLNRGGDPELDADGEMASAGRFIAERSRPAPDALADESRDLDLLSS